MAKFDRCQVMEIRILPEWDDVEERPGELRRNEVPDGVEVVEPEGSAQKALETKIKADFEAAQAEECADDCTCVQEEGSDIEQVRLKIPFDFWYGPIGEHKSYRQVRGTVPVEVDVYAGRCVKATTYAIHREPVAQPNLLHPGEH